MKKRELFKIEYLVYFFVLLIPIFDFLSSQYTKTFSIDVYLKINLIKIIIPVILYIYVIFKTKGKERLQFFIISFLILLYSTIVLYVFYFRFSNKIILKEDFLKIFNNIFNLNVFFINFMIMNKLFFRKNTIKLRMSFNYTSAIYLISILLLSLISKSEPVWQINLSLIILLLLFIALVSLRYREDRTYSLILFIAIFGYYITTIRTTIGYYSIFITAIIYLISIIIEKYVKNQLSLIDLFKIFRNSIIKVINNIRDLNKSTVKRLKSAEYGFSYRNIKGYSRKRIYRLNDLNRKKVFKSKEKIQRYIFNLKYKKQIIEKQKRLDSKGDGLKEVKRRLKEKKRQKRLEIIEKVLNSKPAKIFTTIILILISLCLIYLIFKYISINFIFKFDFKENGIYFIFFIPIIYVIFKTIYFIILKFKNIDSEYIMLTLLIFYILLLILTSEEIILDFSSSIILSTILIILINKIHLGKTKRDIKILKEQVEVKKGLKFKRRVVFGISSLSIGGVSRILVDICNGLSKKYPNLDVEIFTLFAGGEFEEGVNVKIISLFKKPFNSYSKTIRFFISMYLKLFEPNIFNTYIRGNYDTIIAFDEGDITNLFSYHDDAIKIAWIHNKNYNIYSKENKKYLKKTARVYSRYDKIIFIREVGLRRFNKVFTSKRIRRIPKDIITNYVDPLRIFVKSEEEKIFDWTKKDLVLLSVVRLYKHKAIDRFIKVHKRILKDGLFHKVYIIGDGPEMENLKKLIRDEKLQTSVFLLGTKVNPYPYIKACDYFCLFSEREEYSIVLNEAKILNKNILITDTLTRDIILDYPNVRVFDNSESGIYTGLRYVLSRRREDKTNFEYIYQNDDILRQIYSILE